MTHDELAIYVVIRGCASFVFALLAMVISFRRSKAFGRRGYWLWLSVAICWVFLAPFFYNGMSSYEISYTDAFLLRKLHAGAWAMTMAYGLLLGVVLGGLFQLMLRHNQAGQAGDERSGVR